MKQLFILGHNPLLSAAEIISVLGECDYEILESEMLVDSEEKININLLGGTRALGRILYEGDLGEVENFIAGNEIYFGSKTKFTYSLYGDDSILNAIKTKLGKEKLKARYSSKIDADVAWFYVSGYFGVIEQNYDTSEDAKRDMNKPVRRSQLAMPPRLARILVNLSGVKKGEKLADCFCGIGVLLQEALLLGRNVVGVDIDKNAIAGCRKNLEWLRKNWNFKTNYEVHNADSSRVRITGVDGVACEPDLGNLLKKTPSKEEAEKRIHKFQLLMINVLNNLKKYVRKGGRIIFTCPLISIKEGDLAVDIKVICKKTGLRLARLGDIGFPIAEAREGQLVGREIYVLEN